MIISPFFSLLPCFLKSKVGKTKKVLCVFFWIYRITFWWHHLSLSPLFCIHWGFAEQTFRQVGPFSGRKQNYSNWELERVIVTLLRTVLVTEIKHLDLIVDRGHDVPFYATFIFACPWFILSYSNYQQWSCSFIY